MFLAVAAWFFLGPEQRLPDNDRVVVRAEEIAPAPPREMMTGPVIEIAGFGKPCMECHRLFSSDPETPLRLVQHRNIVQAHGMNDRCFNCHDREDRDVLVLPGGATTSFADSARLCATCHGTTFRDWEAGIHGRATGSWDLGSDRRSRLSCVECHDPHAPAFPAMHALPGPDTLRMGEVGRGARGHGKRNPLRAWSHGTEAEEPH